MLGNCRTYGVAALAMVLVCPTASAEEHLRDALNYNRELCGGTFFAIANGTTNDPWAGSYSSQWAQTENALANASSMILHEGVWTKVLHYLPECGGDTWQSNGDWFDDSEESFNSWYETFGTVSSLCGSSAVGCTGIDWAFPGYSKIIAADTVFARDIGWGVINQDTIDDYLEISQFCQSLENVMLHELGHAYGLDHNNSQISTMGNGSFCVKNIHMTRALSDMFWPLDNAQMRNRYEMSGTRRNFSASVYYRDQNNIDGRAPNVTQIVGPDLNANYDFFFSLNRYHDDSAVPVYVQFRFVPISSVPTFNWGTQQWVWPANTSTYTGEVLLSSSGTPDTAVRKSDNILLFHWELPVAGTYRMWMHVDYNNLWSETDEGDNMIPTQFQVVKL